MADSFPGIVLHVRVRIEVAPSISGFESMAEETCHSTHELVEHRLSKVLKALGIPGTPTVEISRPSGTALNAEVLRLWVNGARCRYSHDLVERVYCLVRGLRWAPVSADDIRDWLESPEARPPLASPHQLPSFFATLCEEALKLSPGLLLGPAQIEAYRDLLVQKGFCKDENALSDELEDVLLAIVEQRISIADTQRIGEALAGAVAREISAAELAEELIVSLRARTVEVQLSSEYLRELTSKDDEEEKGIFPLMRDGLFYELGLRIPDIRFATVQGMPPRGFAIKVNDLVGLPWIGLSSKECAVSLTPSALEDLLGEGVQAILNPGNHKQIGLFNIDRKGEILRHDDALTFWSPLGYLVLGCSSELRARAPQLIHLEVVSGELDDLAWAFPHLVQAARRRLTVHQIAGVLRSLLAEEISVRSFGQILPNLMDFDYLVVTDPHRFIVFDERLPTPRQPDSEWRDRPATLAASVRTALKRYISHKYTRGQSTLLVYLLDPEVEKSLADGAEALDEAQEEEILAAVHAEHDSTSASLGTPVILTTVDVRPAVRAVLEKEFPRLAVVAYQELSPDMNIQPISRISLG